MLGPGSSVSRQWCHSLPFSFHMCEGLKNSENSETGTAPSKLMLSKSLEPQNGHLQKGEIPGTHTGSRTLRITFPKESTMYTIYSPIKVMDANRFHKFTAGPVEQHLFVDLRHTSPFFELGLFPKNTIQIHKKARKDTIMACNFW